MATEAVQSYGGLSLVKKDGSHSQRFPLVERRYLFGRAEYCDIRINLLTVSREHAEIVVDEKDQVWVNSLSKSSDTNVCNKPVDGKILLKDNDLLEIGQRKFIFHANNIPEKLPGSAAKGTNGKDAADVGKVKTPLKESNTPVIKPAAVRPPRPVGFTSTPTKGLSRAEVAAAVGATKAVALAPPDENAILEEGTPSAKPISAPDAIPTPCATPVLKPIPKVATAVTPKITSSVLKPTAASAAKSAGKAHFLYYLVHYCFSFP
jgi:pSer/pThr/pTyr-binding forkhead associated (FHA) protein